LVACQKFAPAHLGEIAAQLKLPFDSPQRLGPVRRQFLRRMFA
jgi:hypothetical protein